MGPDHPETAKCLANVAHTLWDKSLYSEAEPHLKRAIEIYEETLGEHPATADTLNNLARVLDAQEAYKEAQPYLARALEISQKLYGEKSFQHSHDPQQVS